MSNSLDTNTLIKDSFDISEDQVVDSSTDFESTSSLRANDMEQVSKENTDSVHKPTIKVKPPIASNKPAASQEAAKTTTEQSPINSNDQPVYTVGDVVRMAREIEHNIRKKLAVDGYVPGATQVISKEKAPELTVDFSKLTMEDIYDLSIPIQAKAFGATDALRVELKDKNYEPRWVNKNPRRLGQFLAYGFIYVEKEDLARNLEVEVQEDAQGHFSLDDVVLMRIEKQKYYAALRAAHERAVRTVSSVGAAKAAAKEANSYMSKIGGTIYAEAVAENKLEFYRPGIEI